MYGLASVSINPAVGERWMQRAGEQGDAEAQFCLGWTYEEDWFGTTHPQEEVHEVIEGELELTIDGLKQVTRPGLVGIVPSNIRHSVKALTDGRAIIVDFLLKDRYGREALLGSANEASGRSTGKPRGLRNWLAQRNSTSVAR